MPIHELLGIVGMDADPSSWVRSYEQGLTAYRMRDFTAAIEHFELALSVQPVDKPSIIMIERCHQFLKSPPASDWRGITTAESK
jgi:adenylate cyclase